MLSRESSVQGRVFGAYLKKGWYKYWRTEKGVKQVKTNCLTNCLLTAPQSITLALSRSCRCHASNQEHVYGNHMQNTHNIRFFWA